MTKIFTLTIVLTLFMTSLHGQHLKKAVARHIIKTAYSALKTSDSTTFVSLWHFDRTPMPFSSNKIFSEKTALFYFRYLREFLDTAISNGLPIDHIEINKTSKEQQTLDFGKYNIRAWFKYRDNYFEGFGFFVDYIDGRWKVRYAPDTMGYGPSNATSR